MSNHKQLYPKSAIMAVVSWPLRYWKCSWWHKTLSLTFVLLAILLSTAYGIGRWYQHSQKQVPVSLGSTFIADYASYLGVDPHETYLGMLNDLKIRQFRLVSYWSDIEPQQGQYDFAELDWEMQQAEKHGAKVSLSIGLRQPRYPECHAPSWVDTSKPTDMWQPQLEQFMATTVNRYKKSPALQTYQLENEYYLANFGVCPSSTSARLASEFKLVKQLDANHPIILSRSDNFPHQLPSPPMADIVGMSVYRRVWDGNITHRYFNYPLPSWYYAFLAGVQQMRGGQPSVLHELQTEPWPPNGKAIKDISLAEQNKSFDAARLHSTVKFAEQTGLKRIDLWGAEYWYYRAQILHDPSVWNAAKDIFQ